MATLKSVLREAKESVLKGMGRCRDTLHEFVEGLIGHFSNLARQIRGLDKPGNTSTAKPDLPDRGRTQSEQVLSPHQRQNIIDTPKGERPDPESYLSPEYIRDHHAKFDEGGTRFMTQGNLDKYGIAQRDGTSFVMARTEVDELMTTTGGDPRKIENALGLPEGFLDDGVVRVDIEPNDLENLRVPSGNEAGANNLWEPGGNLPGGFAEAVIDARDIPRDSLGIQPFGSGGDVR